MPYAAARRFAPLLLCTLASLPSGTAAQSRPRPFETLDLSVSLLADVNRGALHRHWDPGVALAAGAVLPFYLGEVELGAQYAHPRAQHGDVPGFRAILLYAGWQAVHGLRPGLRVGAGLRGGLMLLRFDGDTLPAFRRSENELGVAARAALRWTPRAPWFAEAAVVYQSVLTRPRIEQVFLSGAVGRRFGTPRWLQEFLD